MKLSSIARPIWLRRTAATDSATTPSLLRDGLVALGALLLSLIMLATVGARGPLLLYWSMWAVHSFGLYAYSTYWLIPRAYSQRRPWLFYLGRFLGVLLLSSLLPFWAILATTDSGDRAGTFCAPNFAFQLLVAAPVFWWLARRQQQRTQQITGLETELGQTAANLDFLRSQINPHFLFNALNTLYGMALQENSERTAQGVQMLGDMMRFMLHENHQPTILLVREIDYLRNYIALQELRTAVSPTITLTTNLAEVRTHVHIAPMLLIPFVENAFKHGISFKQKSWISITLECRHDTLYFDVHNSLHPKLAPEPEPTASSIGLANVRQRLDLLYPGQYELVVRPTVEEFFVHLTLQLQPAERSSMFEPANIASPYPA
jgi:two-component system LytT family sensor kinase